VVKRKGGITDGWYWRLPGSEGAQPAPKVLEEVHSKSLSTFEHLREQVSTFAEPKGPADDQLEVF